MWLLIKGIGDLIIFGGIVAFVLAITADFWLPHFKDKWKEKYGSR